MGNAQVPHTIYFLAGMVSTLLYRGFLTSCIATYLAICVFSMIYGYEILYDYLVMSMPLGVLFSWYIIKRYRTSPMDIAPKKRPWWSRMGPYAPKKFGELVAFTICYIGYEEIIPETGYPIGRARSYVFIIILLSAIYIFNYEKKELMSLWDNSPRLYNSINLFIFFAISVVYWLGPYAGVFGV